MARGNIAWGTARWQEQSDARQEWAPSDELRAAGFLLREAVEAGGSRHVISSLGAALHRGCVHDKVKANIEVEDQLAGIAEMELGKEVGIGELCKLLKGGGFRKLATGSPNAMAGEMAKHILATVLSKEFAVLFVYALQMPRRVLLRMKSQVAVLPMARCLPNQLVAA